MKPILGSPRTAGERPGPGPPLRAPAAAVVVKPLTRSAHLGLLAPSTADTITTDSSQSLPGHPAHPVIPLSRRVHHPPRAPSPTPPLPSPPPPSSPATPRRASLVQLMQPQVDPIVSHASPVTPRAVAPGCFFALGALPLCGGYARVGTTRRIRGKNLAGTRGGALGRTSISPSQSLPTTTLPMRSRGFLANGSCINSVTFPAPRLAADVNEGHPRQLGGAAAADQGSPSTPLMTGSRSWGLLQPMIPSQR